MKRTAKIVCLIVIVAALLISAAACKEPKTNYEKVCDNVSAMQTALFVAADDDYNVKISTMKQEELFIADGIADNPVPITVLSVIPKDAAKLNVSLDYTIQGESESLTGTLAKSKLGISLNAKLSDIDKIGKPVTLTLSDGTNTKTFELTDMFTDIISGDEALKAAYEHFKNDVDASLSDKDSFDRECYVKLITNRDSSNGEYFWYVSFIKDKSDYWSVIVNPANGEILSSRKNSKSQD